MPRDDHHAPKHEAALTDIPILRALTAWVARAVVPALANRAARFEIAGRRWVDETAPRRDRLAGRVAAHPVQVFVALVGVGLVVGTLRGRRARR